MSLMTAPRGTETEPPSSGQESSKSFQDCHPHSSPGHLCSILKPACRVEMHKTLADQVETQKAEIERLQGQIKDRDDILEGRRDREVKHQETFHQTFVRLTNTVESMHEEAKKKLQEIQDSADQECVQLRAQIAAQQEQVNRAGEVERAREQQEKFEQELRESWKTFVNEVTLDHVKEVEARLRMYESAHEERLKRKEVSALRKKERKEAKEKAKQERKEKKEREEQEQKELEEKVKKEKEEQEEKVRKEKEDYERAQRGIDEMMRKCSAEDRRKRAEEQRKLADTRPAKKVKIYPYPVYPGVSRDPRDFL